jgi:hypothetical protein
MELSAFAGLGSISIDVGPTNFESLGKESR